MRKIFALIYLFLASFQLYLKIRILIQHGGKFQAALRSQSASKCQIHHIGKPATRLLLCHRRKEPEMFRESRKYSLSFFRAASEE